MEIIDKIDCVIKALKKSKDHYNVSLNLQMMKDLHQSSLEFECPIKDQDFGLEKLCLESSKDLIDNILKDLVSQTSSP